MPLGTRVQNPHLSLGTIDIDWNSGLEIRMTSHRSILPTFLLLCLCAGSLPLGAEPQEEPLADVHLHWKWNQKEATSTQQAIELLRENRITLAVVTGTPPELALELEALAPDLVIPIYGIYRIPEQWSQWHHDPGLLERVQTALQGGKYQGIGEIHMIGGFISDWRNPVI